MTATGFSLEGRVALVTGGNSGIGRTLALALREAGAKVAIGGRRAERNAVVLAELGGNGGQAMALDLDVCDETSVERAVNAVVERFGRIDILINNAGGVNRKSVMDLDRRDWDRVIAINLTGPFLCTKHAARRMKAQGSGKIINIASVYGLIAPSKGLQVDYTASKHGVLGFTKALAAELGKEGVRVNAIGPGFIATPLNANARANNPDLVKTFMDHTPLGRAGTAEDIVGPAIFLASDLSAYVSGSIVMVDGGYRAV